MQLDIVEFDNNTLTVSSYSAWSVAFSSAVFARSLERFSSSPSSSLFSPDIVFSDSSSVLS